MVDPPPSFARRRRSGLAAIVLALVAVLAMLAGGLAVGPRDSGAGTGTGTGTGTASSVPLATGASAIGGASRSGAVPGSPSTAPPSPASPIHVPLVPVVASASSERSIGRTALARIVAGQSGRPVIVSSADESPLAAALGVTPAPGVRAGSPDEVRAAVAADPAAIGILRAVDVTPDVRALAVDGRALFGAERVRSLDAWPLTVNEDVSIATAAAVFEPAQAWTLVAGGDVMLDRAVYQQAVILGKGADFPWDGGTARIAGTTCCGAAGALLPVGRRTGDEGAVRTLLSDADVALVNLEGPAPDAFSYHPGGLVFTMDPALLTGLKDAGVNVVSLANNHIANAGSTGIADTVRNLDAISVVHAGAGSDLAAARRPASIIAGGLRVAILAYDAIRPDLDATAARAGAAPLRLDLAAADIRAARAAGADVVIVMPHWGVEYTDTVTAEQRQEAAALVAAGADAVIGSHSHWVGPVETIGGAPVLYSLGDLVFQLTHDRRTVEGALADLTFVGRRLVQMDLHPTLILDGAQPNLLDPAGDGAQLLADVRRATAALPPR